MPNVTQSIRSDTGTSEPAAIEAAAKEQKRESASTGPRGVLKELALTRWWGLPTQAPARAVERR
jgi:hypothetical protein